MIKYELNLVNEINNGHCLIHLYQVISDNPVLMQGYSLRLIYRVICQMLIKQLAISANKRTVFHYGCAILGCMWTSSLVVEQNRNMYHTPSGNQVIYKCKTNIIYKI